MNNQQCPANEWALSHDVETHTPPADTFNQEDERERTMFRWWVPLWLRRRGIGKITIPSLDNHYTCICGQQTQYLANATPCSNPLCPMGHYIDREIQDTQLVAHHYLQCRECGDVNHGAKYGYRSKKVVKELKRNPWVPDLDEWSDEIAALGIDAHFDKVPPTAVDDVSDVTVKQTICMECWLTEHGADPDRLRREAAERERSDQPLPDNVQKRRRDRRRERRRNRSRKLALMLVGTGLVAVALGILDSAKTLPVVGDSLAGEAAVLGMLLVGMILFYQGLPVCYRMMQGRGP
jgi:hypothetical protein